MLTDSPGPTRRRGPSSRMSRSPSTATTRTHSVPSEKKASTGVVDADAVAQPDLGVGRDGRADDAQLPPLEIDPQRLAAGPQPLQRLGGARAQRHDRVQAQPAHQRMGGHLVEKGRVGRRGDDG